MLEGKNHANFGVEFLVAPVAMPALKSQSPSCCMLPASLLASLMSLAMPMTCFPPADQSRSETEAGPYVACLSHIPQRIAGVCTGESHRSLIRSSSIVRVIEQPAMSSEVT